MNLSHFAFAQMNSAHTIKSAHTNDDCFSALELVDLPKEALISHTVVTADVLILHVFYMNVNVGCMMVSLPLWKQ